MECHGGALGLIAMTETVCMGEDDIHKFWAEVQKEGDHLEGPGIERIIIYR